MAQNEIQNYVPRFFPVFFSVIFFLTGGQIKAFDELQPPVGSTLSPVYFIIHATMCEHKYVLELMFPMWEVSRTLASAKFNNKYSHMIFFLQLFLIIMSCYVVMYSKMTIN